MAIKKPTPEITLPLQKRLWRAFVSLLKYPRKIAKRYAAYNGAIGEILHETGNINLDILRKRNNKIVNLFIYLPLVFGLAASLASLYLHREDFISYLDRSFAPVYYKGVFGAIGAYVKRIYYIFTAIPLERSDWLYFVLGYSGSIIGAWFLSLNPAFKEEERIIHIFSTLGYIDSEGKPWRVTWTPDAIMIIAFNCDPYQLCANTRFWSSVNFPPSQPRVNKDNMNKFIVQRKYELPSEMLYELKGGVNE